MSRVAALRWWVLPAVVTAVLVVAGFVWKAQCVLPGQHLGLAEITGRMCYTDVAGLWSARDLGAHRFPYLDAVFTPPSGLTGAIEYPVLLGMAVWLVGLPASDAFGFLAVNSVLLGAAAVAVTLLLRGMAGRRVWIWAAAPAMAVYVVYNWDALPVLTSTAAFALLARSRARHRDGPPGAVLLLVVGALLGLGGALKLYPLVLLLPLALWLLRDGVRTGSGPRRATARAAVPLVAAGAVVLATNLPLAIADFRAWSIPIRFQSDRPLSADTMSIWFWALRPFVRPDRPDLQPAIDAATLALTVIAVALVLLVAWRRAAGTGEFPLAQAALAAVGVTIVSGKVASLQYLLWLIPLLVVAGIGLRWILALFAADLALFVGWYQLFGQREAHPELAHLLGAVVVVAVFARAAIILLIARVALRSDAPALPPWQGRPVRTVVPSKEVPA